MSPGAATTTTTDAPTGAGAAAAGAAAGKQGGQPTTRYLFSAVPLQGHFFPTLCVAAALSKRPGTDVSFAALEDKRAAVQAASPLIKFRSLGALSPEVEADLKRQLGAFDKRSVPIERRAPRMGSIVFPFYEEHLYAPLLKVAKEMVAESGGSADVVLVCEHACLALHDVAETLSLPLALLWQLPLCYALAMAGEHDSPILKDPRVPVELPGGVLPAKMSLLQRLLHNPKLKKRQLAVLHDEYVPARHAARARTGAATAAADAGARWRGNAAFAPAAGALPRRPLHIVSGTMLFEPQPARRHALPDGWHLSGPQGVDLRALADERALLLSAADPAVADAAAAAVAGASSSSAAAAAAQKHHPAVRALLAEAERADASIVYVAFGTLATFDDRATIEAMARAFAALAGGGGGGGGGGQKQQKKAFVIWSLPPSGQALLPTDLPAGLMHALPSADAPAPEQVPALLVVHRAEQQLLLSHPRLRLFVSHCGLNSKCEALVRGVPLVAWPLFADQFVNASHVLNEGVGVLVPDDGEDGDGTHKTSKGGTRRDARAIEAIVRRALADGGMAARARELGERLRGVEKGGAEVAADILQAEFEGGAAAGAAAATAR